MAVRNDFSAGEVLAAADLNDTFSSKVDYATPTNAQTGTAYTFVADDAERLTTASNGSAVTLTIPPQSSVTWGEDTILRVANYGAGEVTVDGGSGVTVTNTETTLAQYTTADVVRTASDAWTLLAGGGGNGKILQVVSASASSFTTSSGTFVDVTGVTVTITPSNTSSEVLIMVSTAGMGATATSDVATQLLRDSTAIANAAFFYSFPTGGNQSVPGSIVYVDSPNTTSATTYKLQARSSAANAIRIGGRYDGNFTGPTSIVAMEISA